MTAERTRLPGFGLPVNYRPNKYFPTAVLDWSGTMLTDKKVFDDTVIHEWRQEALATKGIDRSEKMLDWCVAELRDKARSFQRDGMIPTLDLDAAVIKSDTAVSSELKAALRTAAAPLEDIPDRLKDWRPGSNGKVLDLVHPSLFPLLYGRSKILSSGVVEIQDCVDYIGKGEIISKPDCSRVDVYRTENFWVDADPKFWSKAFQWLPCDVGIAGKDVKITSYINNLHPIFHADLYSVIEQFIAKSIPLWDLTLTSTYGGRLPRIPHCRAEYDYPQGTTPPGELGNRWEASEACERWRKTTRVLRMPEPRNFESYKPLVDTCVSLREQFGEHGLQVMVKLANIELTPEKPRYDGGSWHVEGQLNERICAIALYYYDSKNVAANFLLFAMALRKQQISKILPKARVQEIGRVVTREGRLLAFPNVFQHRVDPFKLQDRSKPGHRKILALFLVDPHCHIISTANVPPQQKDWWSLKIRDSERLATIPKEIVDQIVGDVDDFPISLGEAKELRLKLMEERREYMELVKDEIEYRPLEFCKGLADFGFL